MANPNSSQQTDPRVLRLTPADNVAVVITTIQPNELITIDGQPLRFADRVPMGHKVAILPIAAGEKVKKYGEPIGSATRDIRPGEHVHTHNLISDYLPTGTPDARNSYSGQD